ncbi:MAG TPA: hypothetical protein VGF79_06990 [Bacteroidia bacterium]
MNNIIYLMPQKSFEDILKEKTSGFSPIPSADGWDKIAAGLEPEKKRRFLPFYFLAAASIVVVGFLLVHFYPSTLNETKISTTSEPSPLSAPRHQNNVTETGTNNSSSDVITSSDNNLKDNFGQRNKNQNRITISADNSNFSSNLKDQNDNPSILEMDEFGNISTEFLLQIMPASIKFEPQFAHTHPSIDASEISLYKVKIPQKPGIEKFRFFAGINTAALMNSTLVSIKDEFKGQEPYQTEYDNRKKEDMGKMSGLYGFELGMANNRHRLSLGLSSFNVAYQIRVTNANKDVLSGLITRASTFNYYTSDSFVAESSSNGGGYVTNSFKYIGIPLTYGYSIYGKNGVTFSLNAGLQYNHMIKNSGLVYRESSGIYVKQNIASENTLSNNHISASAGFSMNFNMGKGFEFYVNPSIKRSLKAIEQGTVSTNYQQMSLQVGLRFFPGIQK